MRNSRKFSIKAGGRWREGFVEVPRSALLFFVAAYRSLGASHFGGACRFEPSCSVYATDAIRMHRPWVAVRLIVIRLLKCRPGGPWGFDPVPGFAEGAGSRGETK